MLSGNIPGGRPSGECEARARRPQPRKMVNWPNGSRAPGIKPSPAGNCHNCAFNSATRRSFGQLRQRRAAMDCAKQKTQACEVGSTPHTISSLLSMGMYTMYSCLCFSAEFDPHKEERQTPEPATALTWRCLNGPVVNIELWNDFPR